MDPGRALKRKSAPSMFDKMSEEFFGKQRKIFLALAREKGWTVLNADRGIQDIHQEVLAALARETI
jgi:thymidylate kinase